MPSTSTWSKHIPALLQKQDGYCYYCGENLLVGKHKENTRKSQYASIDHVIPRSAKGKNHHTNLVVSCCACNSTKGSIPVDQFVNLLDLDDVEFNKLLQQWKHNRVKEDEKKARKNVRKRRSRLIKLFVYLWAYFPEFAQEFKDAIDADPEGAYISLCGGRRLESRKEKTAFETKLKGCRKRRKQYIDRLPSQIAA